MTNSFETGLFLGISVGICAGGLIAGMLAYDAGLERGKKMAPPQKLVIQVTPAHNLIECNLTGYAEYGRVCRARSRMEMVR